MKQIIYISYDLGVDGDYNGLYKWLDSHQAMECGDSVARINYNFTEIQSMSTEEDTKTALHELLKSLKQKVGFRLNDRIYVASEFFVKGRKQLIGGFIYGKRKPNPWEGYAGSNTEDVIFDEE